MLNVFIPSAYPQNSRNSIITPNGQYDFERFSNSEIKTITDVILNSIKKYPPKYRGIGLSVESYPVMYKARYILHEAIIVEFSNSIAALNQLAVGLAYNTKGYYFYPNSVKCLSSSIDLIQQNDWDKLQKSFMKWKVYSDLAEMCLSLGKLTDALNYAELSRKNKSELYAYDYILPGRILQALDINSCIQYYDALIKNNLVGRYSLQISKERQKAIDLSLQGYTHKEFNFEMTEQAKSFDLTVHNATMIILEQLKEQGVILWQK